MVPMIGALFHVRYQESRQPEPLDMSGLPARVAGRRKADAMTQLVELGVWGRWVIAFLAAAILSLCALAWNGHERRIVLLEEARVKSQEADSALAVSIAEIAVRQQMVIQKLNENAVKLDELITEARRGGRK